MNEDAQRRTSFLKDGYVIVRGLVPPNQLASLRCTVDVLVARERQSNPAWETDPAPRVELTQHLDEATVEPLEFALQDNTLGRSKRLLGGHSQEVCLSQVLVLCQPEFEPKQTPAGGQSEGTDPRNWHRDVRPDHDAALSVLLEEEAANGPAYVQWNISLYDDSILYFVPGSHRRFTSDVETTHLQRDGGTQTPLSSCVCADLKAGDGVAYNNMLLHWGSKYTHRQKRRTMILGYRSVGHYLPHNRECRLPESIADLFPPDATPRRVLERSFALYREEFAVIREIFGMVIAADMARFHAGLARLHPNSEGRLACIVLLSRFARDAYRTHQERGVGQDDAANGRAHLWEVELKKLSASFSESEIQQLWKRFGAVDAMQRGPAAGHVSGFLGKPTDYFFERLPSTVTVDRVIEALFSAQ